MAHWHIIKEFKHTQPLHQSNSWAEAQSNLMYFHFKMLPFKHVLLPDHTLSSSLFTKNGLIWKHSGCILEITLQYAVFLLYCTWRTHWSIRTLILCMYMYSARHIFIWFHSLGIHSCHRVLTKYFCHLFLKCEANSKQHSQMVIFANKRKHFWYATFKWNCFTVSRSI